MKYSIILWTSGAAGWLLTRASIRLAVRFGVLDRPIARKIHNQPTPRMGGVGIVMGASLGLMAAALLGVHLGSRMLTYAIGAMAMAGLGLVDDVVCLPAARKLAGQVIIATGVAVGIILTAGPGHADPATAIITAITIIILSNAVNLLDGMDGLAAGVVLVASFAYALILLGSGHPSAAILSLAVVGACAGFLPHNWHPARTFMGDSGSLFLGYCLAVQMTLSFAESSSAWSYVACIAIAGLPLVDTALAIIRRLIAHRPLFKPDKSHAYNMLAERLHLGSQKTVLAFYAAGMFFAIVGVISFTSKGLFTGLAMGLLCLLLTFTINTLKLFHMDG